MKMNKQKLAEWLALAITLAGLLILAQLELLACRSELLIYKNELTRFTAQLENLIWKYN